MGLFARLRRPKAQPPAPAVPAGTRLYAVGDIHGSVDLLDELHEQIRNDASGFEGSKRIIYLGDYVDRGTQSREVIGRLMEGPLPGFECVCLRGNHEQTLLDFLDHPEQAAGWLNYGGLATLLSYGVRLERAPFEGDLPMIAEQLAERLPDSHRQFLAQLPLHHQEGNYLFVHAGIRPAIALERQHPDDLMWIRDDFIGHPGPHDFIVVHGHSITDKAQLLPHRIGIDTGACVSGVLTCLVLEGNEQRLIQTGA